MKAEDLIIGAKYVPHAKTAGCSFKESEFKDKEVDFMYYRRHLNCWYEFTVDPDSDVSVEAEYYSPEDMTPYIEPYEIKVGDVLSEGLVRKYRDAGGQLYYLERWCEVGWWFGDRKVLVVDVVGGRKSIKVTNTGDDIRLDYDFLLKIINKDKQQPSMKKNTITRAGLKELNEIVCNGWRNAIRDLINDKPFEDEFEVGGELLSKAYSEANNSQKAVLNKYFTEPVVFDSTMLEDGEMMEVGKGYNYEGEIILRVYDRFVSLTGTSLVWDLNCKLKGTKLPAGTSITVVSK